MISNSMMLLSRVFTCPVCATRIFLGISEDLVTRVADTRISAYLGLRSTYTERAAKHGYRQ
jgi:hypothetical protein